VVEAAVEVEAVVEAVVEDAVNKDGGILFGVLNVLDNNKQRRRFLMRKNGGIK
jgi:hypothetical protein